MASKPDLQGLRAPEVDAIRIASKALPDIMKNLVLTATSSKSESQRRQAAELILKYAQADRQQQFEVAGQINSTGGAVTQQISLTKVDARLVQIMDRVPMEIQQKFADAAAELQSYLDGEGIEVYEGEAEAVVTGPTCECGCGAPVKKYAAGPKKGQYAKFVRGHHMRAHVALPAIIEARKHSPQENIAAKRERERMGLDA